MKKIVAILTTLLWSFLGFAQPQTVDIHLEKEKIFSISRGIGSFSTHERAQAVEARIKHLAKGRLFDPEKLKVIEFENSSNVSYEDRILITISNSDALDIGKKREVYANEVKNLTLSAIQKERDSKAWRKIALAAAYTFISTIVLVFILFFFARFFPQATKALSAWKGTRIPSITIRSYEVLPAQRLVAFLVWLTKGFRIILTLLILYFYIPLVLSFFPWTVGWSEKIYSYIANPISRISHVIVDYIPNLFFIAVILILTSYLLKFLKFIFSEIERGSIKFTGFFTDWAMPTYKLVRFLVMAFTLVVIFPYLPGSGSPAFQGISVFLGVLITFSSSSAVSNIVSGVVLTYMRPFKVGDRVKISDTIGDVVEKNLLVTRVRTTKNVDVTIPNSMVLGSHIINHSSSAKDRGLVLHTTITLGYDLDWRVVHETLIAAAKKVEGVLDQPEPFVLQKSLDDFYVSYELNAYTEHPNKMTTMYSELHQNIQDLCKEKGIEIMSPHYSALRDGSQITIPGSEMRTKNVTFPQI